MTDVRQLQIFADCPFGGCEDGYCACLEQDVDEDYFAELDDEEIDPDVNGDEAGALRAELVGAYGVDPAELDHLDEAGLLRLLLDLEAGRALVRAGRIRSIEAVPGIDTYTPEGARL